MLHLIFSLFLIQLTAGQTEYICTNSTITGDLQVTILVSNHYGSACDKAAPASALNPLSKNITQWSRTALPASLTIGLRVIDVCGDADKASKSIHELVPWSSLYGEDAAADVCTVTPSPESIGIISDVQPISYELTSLLLKASIPFVVAKDGYQTDNGLGEQHPSYAVGDSLEVLLEILSKFMVALKWDFLTVVHSDDAEGVESYEVFRSLSSKYYLCIDKVIKVNSELLNEEIDTKGVVYLGSEGIGLQVLTMADLKGKTWVTALNIKGLIIGGAGVVYSLVRSGEDLLTQALAGLGKAMASTITEENCNKGNLDSCYSDSFKERFLTEVDNYINGPNRYTIRENGDVNTETKPSNRTYQAFMYPSGVMVATITLSEIMTESSFREEPSLCDPGWTDCRSKCGHLQRKFLYIPGDWMIVMSLPVGKEVDSTNRWTCADFTQIGLYRTEAASYAFSMLRQKYPDVLEQNTGLLVLDSCGDKLKTAGIVYDLVRGDLDSEICDPENPTNCFDHTKIAVFIGDYSSAVSQQIQTVLEELPIIQISYGASSITLSDRDRFPYFLRTNPPDGLQAHFMVELIKRIRDESRETVNAVNILYTDGLYGRSGAEEVKKWLALTDICLYLERKVNETRANDFTELVNNIIEQSEDVRIIIAFLDPPHVRNLMDTIGSLQFRNSWLSRGFSFIFSDTWNDDPELLAKYGELVKGSFSFKFNADFESENLASDLMNRALPTVENINPWLSTLEQEVGECKLRGNFMSEYPMPCQSAQDLSSFAEESYSVHMMKALTTATLALQSLAFNHLQSNPNYLYDPDTITLRYNSFLQIEITSSLEGGDRTHQPFTQRSPDSDTYGNGKVGYTVYNIKDEPKYVEIVQTGYDSMEGLGEFVQIASFYKSGQVKKDIESSRPECNPTTTPTLIATTTVKEDVSSAVVAVMAVMGSVIAVLIILVGVYFGKKYWMRNKRPENQYSDVSHYSGSINPGSHGAPSYMMSRARDPYSTDGSMDIYQQPTNNTLIRGLDNMAYTESDLSETNSVSANISTGSVRNPLPPTPAPRSSDDPTLDDEALDDSKIHHI